MKKKKKLVEALIKNEKTQWTEDDREDLMEFSEELLNKMSPVANEESDEEQAAKDKAAEETKAAETKAAETKAAETKASEEGSEQNKSKEKKPLTVDEYIDEAPEGLQDVLRNGLNSYNADKKRFVSFIIANKKNTFTKEQLSKKGLEELRALARLASSEEEQQLEDEIKLNFGGQREVTENADAEEPLEAPAVVNADKKEKAA